MNQLSAAEQLVALLRDAAKERARNEEYERAQLYNGVADAADVLLYEIDRLKAEGGLV